MGEPSKYLYENMTVSNSVALAWLGSERVCSE